MHIFSTTTAKHFKRPFIKKQIQPFQSFEFQYFFEFRALLHYIYKLPAIKFLKKLTQQQQSFKTMLRISKSNFFLNTPEHQLQHINTILRISKRNFFLNPSAPTSGQLLVNGRLRDDKWFRRRSCYIMQNDQLQDMLTVEESLNVACDLKLGAHVSREQKCRRVSKREFVVIVK